MIIKKGRERNPAFNLSAFYNPQVLLSLFKLETIRTKNQVDDTCCIESLVFQTEMTARDKEHVILSSIIYNFILLVFLSN